MLQTDKRTVGQSDRRTEGEESRARSQASSSASGAATAPAPAPSRVSRAARCMRQGEDVFLLGCF